MGRNLPRHRLPAQLKLWHVNHEMGIAHGNRDAGKLSIGELDGELVPYLRLAHVAAKLEAVSIACGQGTSLQAGARTNDGRTAVIPGAIPCSHAARSVTRNLRLGAIGIQ